MSCMRVGGLPVLRVSRGSRAAPARRGGPSMACVRRGRRPSRVPRSRRRMLCMAATRSRRPCRRRGMPHPRVIHALPRSRARRVGGMVHPASRRQRRGSFRSPLHPTVTGVTGGGSRGSCGCRGPVRGVIHATHACCVRHARDRVAHRVAGVRIRRGGSCHRIYPGRRGALLRPVGSARAPGRGYKGDSQSERRLLVHVPTFGSQGISAGAWAPASRRRERSSSAPLGAAAPPGPTRAGAAWGRNGCGPPRPDRRAGGR